MKLPIYDDAECACGGRLVRFGLSIGTVSRVHACCTKCGQICDVLPCCGQLGTDAAHRLVGVVVVQKAYDG